MNLNEDLGQVEGSDDLCFIGGGFCEAAGNCAHTYRALAGGLVGH